jgi:hypothetical protein
LRGEAERSIYSPEQTKEKTTKTTKDMNPKLMQLKQAKLASFDKVVRLATELLPNSSPYTFELLYSAFKEYEKLENEEHKSVKKYSPEHYNLLYLLFTSKTIADVWWRLQVPIRGLWMQVPELKAWKGKYK